MSQKKFASLGAALLILAAFGCGGGKDKEAEDATTPDSTPAKAAAPAAAPVDAADAATVTGMVKFEGAAPKAETIKMKADPVCDKLHPQGHSAETVVVGAGGELANVFVYIKDYKGPKMPTTTEPAVIDQQGCTYHPHVFGVMAKQPIKIKNSDDTLHNIHAMPASQPEFNIAMPLKNTEQTKTFEKTEIMVKFKCDVHPWMSAWVGVLDHPFFGTSGADGKFSIKSLPPGKYTVEAWHEVYGTQTQEIEVKAKETKDISFSFKPKA